MPKLRQPSFEAVPLNANRTITAAASRIDMTNDKQVKLITDTKKDSQWQSKAWDHYDAIGVIKYSANLLANTASRVLLYPAYNSDPSRVPVNINKAVDNEHIPEEFAEEIVQVLSELGGSGDVGISGIIRDFFLNMFITGECWLIQEEKSHVWGTETRWTIRSVDEIISLPGAKKDKPKFGIKKTRSSSDNEATPIQVNSFVSRMWRSHPRFKAEADSSMLALIDDCEEYLMHSRSIRATSRSKIPSGILLISEEIAAAYEQHTDDLEDDQDVLTFEDDLVDALIEPINSEGDVSEQVPLVVRVPNDRLGESIRHISLERNLDNHVGKLAEDKLDSILRGLDIPKDIATGLDDVKYTNSVVIEDSLYKAHVEPMVVAMCDQLTIGYLRPILRSRGIPEDIVNKVVVWYDPTAITAKPSKSSAADKGYEFGVLSGESWRKHNGFSEDDAPQGHEVVERLAFKNAVISETILEALIRKLTPELLEEVRGEQLNKSSDFTTDALLNALDGNPTPPVDDPNHVYADVYPEDAQMDPEEDDTYQNVAPGVELIEPTAEQRETIAEELEESTATTN